MNFTEDMEKKVYFLEMENVMVSGNKNVRRHCLLLIVSLLFAMVHSLALSILNLGKIKIQILSVFLTAILCFAALNTVLFFINRQSQIYVSKQYGRKHWFYCFLLILLSYSICFLTYFPGVGMNDGLNIMCWGIGQAVQFPLFYCAFIVALTWIGHLFGSLQITIILYTIIQVLVVSAISAAIIVWFWNRPVHKVFKISLFIYFFAEPLLAMYAVSMLKDTLFSLFLTVLMILIYELVHDRLSVQNKWYWIIFLVVSVCVIYTRNNGSYIMVPCLILLFAFCRTYRKQITFVFIGITIAILLAKIPFFIFHREPLFQEAAGIPLQQIAAVCAEDGELTKEQTEFLEQILPLEEWKLSYNPNTVDTIKWQNEKFDRVYLNEHKREFLKVWAQLLPHHLGTYIKAYLHQTYWFWAPVQRGTVQCYYSIETFADNQWLIDFTKENGIHDQPLLPEVLNRSLRKYYGVARYYLREGVCFWIMLFSAVLLCLKNKRCHELLIFLPSLFLWLTIMISTPVNSSMRYVFVFVYMLPIVVGMLFFGTEGNK